MLRWVQLIFVAITSLNKEKSSSSSSMEGLAVLSSCLLPAAPVLSCCVLLL
jgi:hypothetical protein